MDTNNIFFKVFTQYFCFEKNFDYLLDLSMNEALVLQ